MSEWHPEGGERSLVDLPARPWWARGRIGEWFSSPWNVFIALGVVPAMVFLAIGWLEDSFGLVSHFDVDRGWSVGGEGARGLLEDGIFLTYFFFAPMVVDRAMRAVKATERAFEKAALFLRVGKPGEPGISEAELAALRDYTTCLLRGSRDQLKRGHAALLKDRLEIDDIRWGVRLVDGILVLATVGFIGASTYNHANSLDIYGFPIWADFGEGRFLGFGARFIYEGLAYFLVGIVGIGTVVRIFIAVTTILKALANRNAIRHVPYPYDDAGHLRLFGVACVEATVIVAPLLIPALVYVWTYPVTQILVAGVGLLSFGLPLLFFLPTWRINRMMRELMDEELLLVTKDLNKLYERARAALARQAGGEGQGDDELQQILDMLEKVELLYRFLQNANLWPFRRKTVAVAIGTSTVVASTILGSLLGGG